MVVVVDATGSMQTIRSDGTSRFEAARALAADRVLNAAMEVGGLTWVAVYTFAGSSIQQETTGGTGPSGPAFVSPTTARNVILNQIQVTSNVTPLADALCQTADIAAAATSAGSVTTRFLEVWSDGGENSSTGPCSGPFSVSTSAPFDAGSWQNKVYVHFTGETPVVTFNATLFTDVTFAALVAGAGKQPAAVANEAAATMRAMSRTTFAVPAAVLSDSDFFAQLAVATGGNFTPVVDSAPLPVFGDLDGDFDVDRNDAIILARDFGGPALPGFDLNADGKIGFADYAIELTKLGNGSGTPAPDPYTKGQTIQCSDDGAVVIDGQAIEDFNVTIDAANDCSITIRNSLIVSGNFAVKSRGNITLTVDDSIIVGEAGWLSSQGVVRLSAANSVFHGKSQSKGQVKYTDRGRNVFE